MIDGADNNEVLLGIVTTLPPPEALGEFKIQTNNFSAEFGRAGGAVINVATRSGTNELHGSVYEFLRNNALDARGPFDRGDLPPLRQNDFGATLGGPLERNRTFLFGDYSGFRQRAGQSLIVSVPTVNQRTGVFLASEGSGTIYDPNTFPAVPFPANTIPALRQSAQALFTESHRQMALGNSSDRVELAWRAHRAVFDPSLSAIVYRSRAIGNATADGRSPTRPCNFQYLDRYQETPDARPKPLNLLGFRARPERFELPTFGSVDRRSIQLSYGRGGTSLDAHTSARSSHHGRARAGSPGRVVRRTSCRRAGCRSLPESRVRSYPEDASRR